MSNQMTGTITQLKDVVAGVGRNGRNYRKRSIQVDGQWFSGFLNDDNAQSIEGLQPGDQVDLEYEISGDYKNFKSVVVKGHSAVPTAVAAAPAAEKENNYQQRMNFIGAQTRALKFVEIALVNGAASLPATKNKGLSALDDLVAEYTAIFAQQAWEATNPSEEEVVLGDDFED